MRDVRHTPLNKIQQRDTLPERKTTREVPKMATRTSAAEMLSYEDLYSRWEQGNWKSSEFDFSQDREDWREKFSDLERRAALWNYSMFFHGEDSVADNLSPYIDAAPPEEHKYFLTTQQPDEARHAPFFPRFMPAVVHTPDSIAAAPAPP